MARTPQHTYQVLTKRHGRMRSLLSSPEFQVMCFAAAASHGWDVEGISWPLPNVWLGVSVEDQKWADIRIPALCATPAAVRFLSCEPLLGPVKIPFEIEAACPACGGSTPYPCDAQCGKAEGPAFGKLHWVIVGGESGAGARPMEPGWARSLVWQCADWEVPVFVKQLGKTLGRELGAGSKGGDWEAWPEDLRVREFPAAAVAVAS
jgi:protein gp37